VCDIGMAKGAVHGNLFKRGRGILEGYAEEILEVVQTQITEDAEGCVKDRGVFFVGGRDE